MQKRLGFFVGLSCWNIRRRTELGARSVPCMLVPSLGTGLAHHTALGASVRFQSVTPEKRFHCGVCKKAFRLEMAARLHVQQAHGGEGLVQTGAGPGQVEGQQSAAPIGAFRSAPPQAPTVIPVNTFETSDRAPRREKPAPKPLHEPEREVPLSVMKEMLSVWDEIGLRRVGNSFVHSTMVMKVFAAKPPSDSEPLYGTIEPEGSNPFGQSGDLSILEPTSTVETQDNIYSLNLSDAFALASGESLGPMRPARCINPLHRKIATENPSTTQRTSPEEQTTAPVTPFGQLPVFGQVFPGEEIVKSTVSARSMSDENSPVVLSPFSAAVADSPFAGQTDSPFAGKGFSPFEFDEGSTNVEASDTPSFNASQLTAPSPFLPHDAAVPSPFAFPSPFGSMTSPVVEGGVLHPNVTSQLPPAEVPTFSMGVDQLETPTFNCTLCERTFSTYEGLRMHSKVKHEKSLPRKDVKRPSRSAPELPAYIPSSVDLSTTSPFGVTSNESSWTEVELIPYAQSVSNITLAGRVLEVETKDGGWSQLTLYVCGESADEDETVIVRCSPISIAALDGTIRREDYVYACGTLRLLSVSESSTMKQYLSPIVYVTLPMGMIAKF